MITTFELFNDIDRLQKTVFGATQNNLNRYNEYPPINVIEDNDHVRVKAFIPGVESQNVDATFENGVLTLSGRRVNDHAENQTYICQERLFGEFNRSIKIKIPVNQESIKAIQSDGVLEIVLEKLPKAKPVKIEIQ